MAKQQTPAKAAKRPVRSLVASILMLGVVLGIWRFLGDGANITDPQWVPNAIANMKELMGVGGDVGNRIKDNTEADLRNDTP